MPVNDLEKVVIDKPIIIPQGRNGTKYINKEIEIETQIFCEGSLVFENCIINYKPFENKKRIILKEGSDVKILNCTVKGITDGCGITASYISSLSSGNNIDEYELNEKISDTISFIEYENHYDKCNLEINNSYFTDCSCFAKVYKIAVNNSVFEYSTKEIAAKSLYAERESKSSITNCLIKFSDNDNNIELGDYLNDYTDNFIGDDEVKDEFNKLSSEEETTKLILNIFNDYVQKNNSGLSRNDLLFYLISSCVKERIFNGFKQISYSTFNGVFSVIGEVTNVKSCDFINCTNLLSTGYDSANIDDCVFVNCRQNLIKSNHNFSVNNCAIFNSRTRGTVGIYGPSLKNKGKIKNCTFDGLDVDSSFIESGNNGGFDGPNVTVENCTFKNCVASNGVDIISKNKVSSSLFNWKEATAVSVHGCNGINTDYKTGKADSVPKEHKDRNGDIIGAKLDENKVGVPL